MTSVESRYAGERDDDASQRLSPAFFLVLKDTWLPSGIVLDPKHGQGSLSAETPATCYVPTVTMGGWSAEAKNETALLSLTALTKDQTPTFQGVPTEIATPSFRCSPAFRIPLTLSLST